MTGNVRQVNRSGGRSVPIRQRMKLMRFNTQEREIELWIANRAKCEAGENPSRECHTANVLGGIVARLQMVSLLTLTAVGSSLSVEL
jgi:hypothetical protein